MTHRYPLFLSLLLLFLASKPASAFSLWGTPAEDTTLPLSALIGFKEYSGDEATLSNLNERIFQELFKTRKWRLIERQRVDAILREKALQESGACLASCADSIGGMLGATTLIVPSLDRIDGISHLSLREVSASSGEVLRMADAETDEPLPGSSKRLVRLAVARLIGDPSATTTDSGAISVTTNTPARIWIDGQDVGQSPLTVPVWPGVHRVAVIPGMDKPVDSDRPAPDHDFEADPTIVFYASSGYSTRRDHHYASRRPHHTEAARSFSSRSASESSEPASKKRDKSKDDDDASAAIVAGAVVAAVGIGLVAAAASMPDSVWTDTWRDVKVKAADTAQVQFNKEPNGSKQSLGAIGIIGLILGIGVILIAVASKH